MLVLGLLHTAIAGLLRLLLIGLLLEKVALGQLLLHLQLLLLLREQLGGDLGLRVQLHLELLEVLLDVLVRRVVLPGGAGEGGRVVLLGEGAVA